MKTNLLLAFLVSVSVSATSQVTIAIVKPPPPQSDLLVLSGSIRPLFLNITGGTANTASWTTSPGLGNGSVILTPGPGCNSISACNTVVVTAGTTAGLCPIQSSQSGQYSIKPTVTATVTATSLDDRTKSDIQTFDICSPTLQVDTVPFYRVLFSGQSQDVQAWVTGSANLNGKWSITQPAGGDGSISSDSTSRDTVFVATVAGRYKVTFTPDADPSVSAYTTLYVTGNKMPYNVTQNGTEPIDCTADPNATGTVYEVGPSQKYKSLEDVSWNDLAPGSTVRLHNEDATCSAPTLYPEYIEISSYAQHDNPIRLCGLPDPCGNLPIMEGNHATARADLPSTYVAGYAGIDLFGNNYSPYPTYTNDRYILVEGIHVRDYNSYGGNTWCPAGAGSAVGVCSVPEIGYGLGTSGIRVSNGEDFVLAGLDVDTNGNGIFSDFYSGNKAWGGLVANGLYEGNHLRHNGVVGDDHEHGVYLQGLRQVVQFNDFEIVNAGSQYKDRGTTILRYNYFGTNGGRENDFVDLTDSQAYLDPDYYLTQYRPGVPDDQFTGDLLAAAQEQWHSSVTAYGNIYAQGEYGTVHLAADNVGGSVQRVGRFLFYNNLFNLVNSNYRFSLFDTGDGNDGYPHFEWPTLDVQNNILWGFNDAVQPYFSWNTQRDADMTFGTNLLPLNWGTNDLVSLVDGTGWPFQSNRDVYAGGNNLWNNVSGNNNFLTTSTIPFDPNTYLPTSQAGGSPLTRGAERLPVRFQYLPASGFAVLRSTPVTGTDGGILGAGESGTAPTLSSITLSPASVSLSGTGNQQLSATCSYSNATTADCTSTVTWSNAGSAVFTVSSSGLVTGISAGTGTVTAALGSLSGSGHITDVRAIQLYNGNFTLAGSLH